jgi:hypothetical protein
MTQCPDCGAERRYVGVLYPVRRLCKCEVRVCVDCGKKAVVVEFQAPVKGVEPPLPTETNNAARFFCKKHCPEDFSFEAAPKETPEPEGPFEEALPPGQTRKVRGAPHIDPVWDRISPSKPPAGADSSQRVECVACKHAHKLKDRKLWNGSYSYCPKCGENMYVPIWDEEDTRERQGTSTVRTARFRRADAGCGEGEGAGTDDVEGTARKGRAAAR